MRVAIVLGLVLGLAGCASRPVPYYVRDDGGVTVMNEFERDRAECRTIALGSKRPTHPGKTPTQVFIEQMNGTSEAARANQIHAACMRSKGWVLKTRVH